MEGDTEQGSEKIVGYHKQVPRRKKKKTEKRGKSKLKVTKVVFGV